jgi:hypothetical protein
MDPSLRVGEGMAVWSSITFATLRVLSLRPTLQNLQPIASVNVADPAC